MENVTTKFVNQSSVNQQIGTQNFNGRYIHYEVSSGRDAWVGDRIPYARGAMYNSFEGIHAECHPGTRVELLQRIQSWARSTTGKRIFWLQGRAGTGKSTISQSVARWLELEGMLGASFFFKRGEYERGNASLFFSTITRQLLGKLKLKDFESRVAHAIREDPEIFHKLITEQFDKLLYLPLKQQKSQPQTTLQVVVVVDALDECDNDKDIRRILRLWSGLSDIRACQIRLFITSRPELPVRLEFNSISEQHHQDVDLHDVPESVTREDLLLYLKHEFATLCTNFNTAYHGGHLPGDWPGQETLYQLVDMAHPLFIVAATISRFIGDENYHPVEQLSKILDRQNFDEISQTDKIYRPILDAVPHRIKRTSDLEAWYKDFQYVVGSIILLAEPLSAESLASLLQLPVLTVNARLRPLHSCLVVPNDPQLPIRYLHLSFSEFLQKEQSSTLPYFVDSKGGHGILASKCLELLSKPDGLREDICGLAYPGMLTKDIKIDAVAQYVSTPVRYACQHWVHHLESSQASLCDDGIVHEFLQKHLLHWFEVLCLIKSYPLSIGFLNILQSLTEKSARKLLSLLEDAKRFCFANRHVAETAPLQIYSSAVLFAPETSLIKRTYGPKLSLMEFHGRTQLSWNANRMDLEVVGAEVYAIAVSRDGNMIAAGLDDSSVVIWDLMTGRNIQRLLVMESITTIVEFSPDDRYLVTYSRDRVIIFDLETGQSISVGELHESRVKQLLFLHSHALISMTVDGAISIWDLQAGQRVQEIHDCIGMDNVLTLTHMHRFRKLLAVTDTWKLMTWNIDGDRIHSFNVEDISTFKPDDDDANKISAACFSFDSSLVALHTEGAVLVINVITLEVAHQYLATKFASSIALSRDNRCLAVTSLPGVIKVQDMHGDQSSKTLESETFVSQVTFSNDSSLLVSNSGRNLIQLWDTNLLHDHSLSSPISHALTPFAVSRDRTLIASISGPTKIDLCNVTDGFPLRTIDVSEAGVQSLVLSEDATILALALFDMTIIIFNLSTNKKLLKTSTNPISSFSSMTKLSPTRILVPCLDDLQACLLWNFDKSEVDPLKISLDGMLFDAGFSPDDSYFAVTTFRRARPELSSDHLSHKDLAITVQLWDANCYSHFSRSFLSHYIQSIFSCFQDQWLLAIVSSYSREYDWIDVYDLSTTASVARFSHRGADITGLAFSANHQLFTSADRNGLIRLFDLHKKENHSIAKVDTRYVVENMSFSTATKLLYCKTGNVRINIPSGDTQDVTFSKDNCLALQRDWIVVGQIRVLWLPPQYRLRSRIILSDTIALCRATEFVGYLKIDLEGIMTSYGDKAVRSGPQIAGKLMPDVTKKKYLNQGYIPLADDEDKGDDNKDSSNAEEDHEYAEEDRSVIHRMWKMTGDLFKSRLF